MTMIAEIGINHNGDIKNALKLIDIAKDCGCDVVKFQKRNPDLCIPENQKLKKRVFQNKQMTYIEYKYLLEFGKNEYDVINKYCQEKNIKWTASVWDVDSVHFMEQYKKDIPFIKIPSACITNLELLKAINETNIPVVFSNGMSTQEEVDKAIQTLNNIYGIMHCNSSYPCSHNQIDLNVMLEYKKLYPNLKIGYSGHEEDLLPTILAIALGADIIERHITLDNNMEGTDQKASLNPIDLKQLLYYKEEVYNILGSNTLHVYPEEEKTKNKLRR